VEPALAALLLLVVLFAKWRRTHRRRSRADLGRGAWGTIYVFHDPKHPDVVKVGTTRRLSKVRKAEVSRHMAAKSPLVQVFAIDMPFARAVEAEAHRLLRKHRARWAPGSSRGREWFVLPDQEGLAIITDALERAAWKVRAAALQQGRWWDDADTQARKSWRDRHRYVRSLLFQQPQGKGTE
jgi:hypothetical protein